MRLPSHRSLVSIGFGVAIIGSIVTITLYKEQFTAELSVKEKRASFDGVANKTANTFVAKDPQGSLSPAILQETKAVSAFLITQQSVSTSVDLQVSTPLVQVEPAKFSLIIGIVSEAGHFVRRMGVRKTWGSRRQLANQYGDRVLGPIFFVGPVKRTGNEADVKKIMRSLESENKTYGDIVNVPTEDDFRNLTPKMLDMFKYVTEKYAKEIATWKNFYFLKADDDTYVNLPLFVQQQYEKMMAQPPVDAFYCYVFRDCGVIRNPGDKYYVSFKEYPDNKYPWFCSGMAYMFRAALLPKIVEATTRIKPLPMEDTYYTGVIAKDLGITHIDITKIDPFHELDQLKFPMLCQYGAQQEKTVVHRLSKKQMQVINACIVASSNSDDDK